MGNPMKKTIVFFALLITLLCLAGSAHAATGTQIMNETFNLSGMVYNATGDTAAGINVSITIYNGTTAVASNWSTSDHNGTWNITGISNNTSAPWNTGGYTYKIRALNTTAATKNFTGSFLPPISVTELHTLSNLSIYIQEAYTLNVTVMNNTTGDDLDLRLGESLDVDIDGAIQLTFKYKIYDANTTFVLYEELNTGVTSISVGLPRGKNYTMMVYPNTSIPFSYDIYNASSSVAFSLANNVTLLAPGERKFNDTGTEIPFIWVAGNITTSTNASNNIFDNLTMMAWLMDGNGRIDEDGMLPFNLSASAGATYSDWYDPTNGSFNITLPFGNANASFDANKSTENITVMIFAALTNCSGGATCVESNLTYYGAFRNLTMVVDGAAAQGYNVFNISGFNMTAYELQGDVYNISIPNRTYESTPWTVTSKLMTFNLTNGNVSPRYAHVTVDVNYTAYTYDTNNANNTSSFTWVKSVRGTGGNGNFSIPVFSAPIDRINVYTSDSVFSGYKAVGLVAGNLSGTSVTLTMDSYKNSQRDGTSLPSVTVQRLTHNTTCNEGNFSNASGPCTAQFPDQPSGGYNYSAGDFDVLQTALGGGNYSLRVVDVATNFTVHYAGVNSLVGVVPDVHFNRTSIKTEDDNSNNTESDSNLVETWIVGSFIPRDSYDYVILGLPYNDSRFNETGIINVSVLNFYDENWNVEWNPNGSTPLVNASTFLYEEWNDTPITNRYFSYSTYWNGTGMIVNNTTAVKLATGTSFAYITPAEEMIWIRVPHFSGIELEIRAQDDEQPNVTLTVPGDGNTGVDITDDIVITFNDKMDMSTITVTNLWINKTDGTGIGNVISTSDNTTITMNPNNSLTCGTKYNATIETSVEDSANNSLATQYTWDFTTATCGGGEEDTSGAGSGGAGSGGTASSPTPIEQYFEEAIDSATNNIVEEANVQLVADDVMGVSIEVFDQDTGSSSSESHTLTVREVGSGYAVVTIASTPMSYTLKIATPKYVDLNGDSISDLKLTLNGVKRGIADITVTKVESGFAAARTGDTTVADTPAPSSADDGPSVVSTGDAEDTTETTVPSTAMDIPTWVYWLIVIVVVVAGIAYWSLKKK
jgi:hypothetical protein